MPHAATEKVKVSKSGDFFTEDINGIRRLQLPVEYHNLEQYLRDLKSNEKEIRKMRKKGRYFAFRYYGGHSRIYADIDLLLDELMAYKGIAESINRRDARQMNEIYRNLEIVEITKGAWERSKEASRVKARAARRAKPHARKRKLEKLKRGPAWKLDEYRRKRAEQARAYRARMTGAEKEEYKKKASERAKKSNKRNRP